MLRKLAPRKVIPVVLGMVLVALSANVVSAWTASNLVPLSIQEDYFYNYDFGSKQVSNTNCDWPVTMLFWNNAEIDKVKEQYRLRGWFIWGLSKYAKLDDGAGWVWDSDCGVKKLKAGGDFIHMRLYADADDRMFNLSWGYYVLGTTHYDRDGETKCGWSEDAEHEAAAVAQSVSGWGVVEDWGDFYNHEDLYKEVDEEGHEHWWQCDGYATAVYVPCGTKGDFDFDGDIDIFDFVLFAVAYGSYCGEPNYNSIGDFDDDCDIDILDFVAFAEAYHCGTYGS